ncbi:MAG: hypothetical protein ACXAC7_10210 [Candidatus Hodarchaeales archaeon]
MSFQRSGEYEDLFSAYKRERQLKELQSLPLDFFLKFTEYLQFFNADSHPKKSLVYVIHNRISWMLNQLYELRKNKIILNVNQNSKPIQTERLSQAEKRFYLSLIVAKNLFPSPKEKPSILSNELKEEFLRSLPPGWIDYTKQSHPTKAISSDMADSDVETVNMGEIEVIKTIPRFLGPDGKTYGPYEPQQIVSVPLIVIKNVLIPRNLAKIAK